MPTLTTAVAMPANSTGFASFAIVQEPSMDPLSGVLSLLKPQNTMCGGFDVGGDWSLPFP